MDIIEHSRAYRWRRVGNWLPMGIAYALLYMGRYNLNVAQNALGDAVMSKAEFGFIFMVGSLVYGFSFIVNGPLTDRVGGRLAMLIGTMGALIANLFMGLVLYGNTRLHWDMPIISTFTVLYAVNMYFQSFGAVAIVTVKAPWFHVHERGNFSTIFGVLIAAGIYFAFDWGMAIVEASRAATPKDELGFWASIFGTIFGMGASGTNEDWMLFFVPSILLAFFWLIMYLWLRNTPAEAGLANFNTGEEKLTVDGKREPAKTVFWKILTHPVLGIVCIVEFASGIIRNGIMQWYPKFAKEVGFRNEFWVSDNWGLALFLCGALGAYLTGKLSDRFFQSRRAPMAVILYMFMVMATIFMAETISVPPWYVGTAVLVISFSVIGVHGIFSGTATADFAGVKNTGAAVGVVDGIVYLGNGVQSIVIGLIAPTGEAAKNPENWHFWPVLLVPVAAMGSLFAALIWGAKPDPQAQVAAKDPPIHVA